MPKQGKIGAASEGGGTMQKPRPKIRKPGFKTSSKPAKAASAKKAARPENCKLATAEPAGKKVKPKLVQSLASKTFEEILEVKEKDELLKLVDQLNTKIKQLEQEPSAKSKKHKKNGPKKAQPEVLLRLLLQMEAVFRPADFPFSLQEDGGSILDLSDSLPQILVQLPPRTLIMLSMVCRKAKSLVDDAPQDLGLWYLLCETFSFVHTFACPLPSPHSTLCMTAAGASQINLSFCLQEDSVLCGSR